MESHHSSSQVAEGKPVATPVSKSSPELTKLNELHDLDVQPERLLQADSARVDSESVGVVAENLSALNLPSADSLGAAFITSELEETSQLAGKLGNSSEEVAADVEEEWSDTLIGVIIGSKPSYDAMVEFMRNHWDVTLPKLFFKENGVMVFKFGSDDDWLWILENGPWFVGGNRPLILKEWKTGMAIDWSSFKSVPVWVKIIDIDPVLLSSKRMLAVIGNMIGVPIMIDRVTSNVEILDYARMLVDVTPEETKRTEVVLKSYDGIVFRHKVEFEWMPWKRGHCAQLDWPPHLEDMSSMSGFEGGTNPFVTLGE